jgi:hypothetical protein
LYNINLRDGFGIGVREVDTIVIENSKDRRHVNQILNTEGLMRGKIGP